MKIRSTGKIILAIMFFVMAVNPGVVLAEDSGLVGILTNQLGISPGQAEGGAGSIFKMAKQGLSDQDYTSLASKIPGLDKMIDAAPEPEEKSGLFGSISSLFGSNSNKLDKMADLKSSFGKLGLGGDMVGQFMPIIYDYVKEKGGETLMNSLKQALL